MGNKNRRGERIINNQPYFVSKDRGKTIYLTHCSITTITHNLTMHWHVFTWCMRMEYVLYYSRTAIPVSIIYMVKIIIAI